MQAFKFLAISFLMILLLLSACNGKQADEPISEGGGETVTPENLVTIFLAGDYESIYEQTSAAFQEEVSLKQLKQLGESFNKDVTSYLLQSELNLGEGMKQYAWIDEAGEKGMVAVMDEDHIIQGLQIMPIESYPETDEVFTKTTFDLPMTDEWFVFWGGTNSLVNYHYAYESQRYAYDFLVMRDDKTYEGDPAKNDSYYAFGKDYLAPADGTVVKVENNIKDNNPVGEMNEKNPLGNYVIIDHGNGEFSYLAHFKHESILVKEGDQVKQGDLLGHVGNSGNSSEPHIHFHVADSADFKTSKSIRIKFTGDRSFIQGDRVN